MSKDFDKNGSMDPIVTYFNPIDNDRFMVHNRLVVIDQIPSIKKRFETFGKFATTPFVNVFMNEELDGAFTGKVNSLASVVLINNKGKAFAVDRLPDLAQLSVINDMLIEDVTWMEIWM